MVSLKRKILNIYGVYFNNYYLRGGSRLSNPIQLALMIFTVTALYLNKNAWWFYPVTIGVIIAGMIFAIVYGWFDYSKRGTRKIETLNAAKSEIQTVIYGRILELQFKIINKLNNPEDKTPIEITEEDKQILKFIQNVSNDNGFPSMIKEDNDKRNN
ncbi:MAG: hypothetical protein ACYCS1_05100 [Gammaproteobacteria bacterium]